MSEPRTIARYAIERRLGSTGPTEAFRARFVGPVGATPAPPPVVIKRLQPALATKDNVNAFLEEARGAAWLDHPNIAQLCESDVDEEGVPFTVMEFVDGPTVAQIILRATETGELPLTRLVAIFVGAAAALDHAHHARSADGQPLDLVHGDVSTDNLRIGLDGVTKVLDFGQARFGPATKSKVRHTAPELLRDPAAKPGPAADVFGLGVCLYLATTGTWPFAGITDQQIKAAAVGGRYRKPSELIPGFPAKLEETICGALEAEPYRRLDARTLADQLADWLSNTGEQMSDRELGEWIRGSFADRHHGTPVEQQAIDEPTPAAIVAVKGEPETFFPFELPPPPPPPTSPTPPLPLPGVASPSPAPAPFARPPTAPLAAAMADPFAPEPGASAVSDYTAVDVSISGITRMPAEVASPQPFGDETSGGDFTSADVALGDLNELTAVRPPSSAAIEGAVGEVIPGSAGPQPPEGLAQQPAEGDETTQDAGRDETGVLPHGGLPASLAPAGRGPGRVLSIAAALVVLFGALGAGAFSWRARRHRPTPPSEARLYIDTAQRAVLADNPALTREMLDRARSLPALTSREIIELATLEDATRFARLLADAETALEAGDTRLARAKLDQVDRALPNSPEAQALRGRVEGRPGLVAEPAQPPPGEPNPTPAPGPELSVVAQADAGAPPEAEAEPESLQGLPVPAPERPAPGKRRTPDRRPSASSILSVKTTPAGATIFVDGARVGTAPVARLRLPPGAHAIALALAGFERHEQALTSDGKPLALEVALVAAAPRPAAKPPARLEVTSSVVARVTLDGEAMGLTPLRGLLLAPGRHVLVATAEGYQSLTREFDLEEGELEPVTLELVKLEPSPPPPIAAPAPTRREPSPEGPITRCPEEAGLEGDAPPAGTALWCATAGGVRHGKYIRWNADGKRAQEGEYVNGRKNGVWIEYFENGTERERTSWRRGVKAW